MNTTSSFYSEKEWGSLLFPKSFFPLADCRGDSELAWTMWMKTKIKETRDLDDSTQQR